MTSVPQVAAALQQVLAAIPTEQAGASGYRQRQSKLTAAAFVQTAVLGWLAYPAGSLAELTTIAADVGVPISPQGLDQRFTEASATLLADVLAAAVRQVVAADPSALPVIDRFAAVEVLDSTTITLPEGVAAAWRSCGGRTATTPASAVKATVRLDLRCGRLTGPELTSGRTQDRGTALQHAPLVPNALRIADLGFWSLGVLAALRAQEAHFLSRLHPQTVVCTAATGDRLAVERWLAEQTADQVELAVTLGVTDRVPARLLAFRLPPARAGTRRRQLRAQARAKGTTPSRISLARAGWTLLVTSVPAERLSAAEAMALYGARWQIERLFKRWKSDGKLAAWRSANPDRIRCELYAKLIALVLLQWLGATGGWDRSNASQDRVAATIRRHIPLLAVALAHPRALRTTLRTLAQVLRAVAPITKRRRRPATFQRLLNPAELALA